MKTYKQAFVVLAVGIFIVPQIAFAAWWNPLSWSIWDIFRSAPNAQVQTITTALTTPTSTTTPKADTNAKQGTQKDDRDALISSLQKQVADLTKKLNEPKIEAPKTSVVVLPSGAVVEMDANGNIIRTIKDAPAQNPTQIVSPSAPTTVLPTETLSIKLGVVTITRPGTPGYSPYHAHLEWSTNIPTNSKVFFAPIGQWQNVNPDGSVNSTYFLVPIGNPLFGYMGATTAVIANSASGYSTMHSVELNNLQEKYQYSYTIEAISGTLDQKITGTFDTK